MHTSRNRETCAFRTAAARMRIALLAFSAADDQQHILEAIELLLRPQGYHVDTVRSPALARRGAVLTETPTMRS